MFKLTKQERTVLIAILLLLATGWGVKAYRTAHPPQLPQAEETR